MSEPKDGWDKAGVIGQWVSGVVIALMGVFVTVRLQSTQLQNASNQQRTQQAIEESAQVREVIESASKVMGRERRRYVALLPTLTPKNVVDIASQFLTDDDPGVRSEAIRVLSSFPEGILRVKEFASQSADKSVATQVNARASEPSDLLARISEIDDLGVLKLNGRDVLKATFPNDSGWVDIRWALHDGVNNGEFAITNGPFGGWAGRIQISAGGSSIDRKYGRDACPCNGQAFKVSISITVTNGRVKTVSEGTPQYL